MSQPQAISTKIVNDKGTLEGLMGSLNFKESLQAVLPKHLTPERVVKMALVAASRQPLLFKCTKESFLQAIMKSAELGLDCSGTLGRAYLIPYYNSKIGGYEAQFMVGYQGLIELARRSGDIVRIESRVVRANDKFEVEYGLDQKLVHKPLIDGDQGDLRCVYAIAELTDGSRQIEVMTIEEIEAIRKRSKAGDSGPWQSDYSEMARKTVIRRLAKYLPLSTEMQKAFESDDAQFNHHADVSNMAERTRERAESLREQLTASDAAAEEVDVTGYVEVEDESASGEIDEEPKLSKAENQRLDQIAAIREIEKDDPERVAIALKDRRLDTMTGGQIKDLYISLTK